MQPGWTEKVIEGIKVEFSACDHCGKSPTDKEILAVLAEQREWTCGRMCDHCGKAFELVGIQLLHSKDKWGSVAEALEPVVNVQLPQVFTDGLRIHLSCAKKMFPKTNFSPLEKRG